MRLLRDWRREAHTETFKRARAALWGWITNPIGSWQGNSFFKELTPEAARVLRENDPNRIIEFSIPYNTTLFIPKTVTLKVIAKEIIVSRGEVLLEEGVSVGPARVQERGMGRLNYQVAPRAGLQSDATPPNSTAQGGSRQITLNEQQALKLRDQLSNRIDELETATQTPDLTEGQATEIMRGAQQVLHELATNDLRNISPLLTRLGLLMKQVGDLFHPVAFPREKVEALISADRPQPGPTIASKARVAERKPPRRNA
jgi:hypothetical protein